MQTTERIWKEFSAPLRGFICKHIQNEDDAEDILQQVFLKIHLNILELKDKNKLQSWIYQIARNVIIDYYRNRRPTIEFSQIPETQSVDGAKHHQQPFDDEQETASDSVSEISLCLRSLINHLPEKYRQSIILNEFEGLTQKKVAERLGLFVPGAKSRVQRARKMLKEMLLECCHFEFDRRGNILDYQPKEKYCLYCSRKAKKQ